MNEIDYKLITVDPWLSGPHLPGILYPELKMTVLLEYFEYRGAFY